MTRYDVFNGDADGICGLLQLRLVQPCESVLVTGVKRDVALLRRVPSQTPAQVTVLDVSLDQNREALLALLHGGSTVLYLDHHHAGEIPDHPGLNAVIDTTADVCTSLLVDRHLGGACHLWAIAGAYGDNLTAAAEALADRIGLDEAGRVALRELGESINYNAYVDSESDLLVHPAALFRLLLAHASPLGVMEREPLLRQLRDTRLEDLAQADALAPHAQCAGGRVFLLPDEPWSRRVRGAWGNQLVHDAPGLAHAVLSPGEAGGYVVSVRAPLRSLRGADALCRQFPTGGGRAAAAGINHLPQAGLGDFVRAFERAFAPASEAA